MLILTSRRQIVEMANLRDPLTEVLADVVETYRALRRQQGKRQTSLRVTSIYRSPSEDAALGASGIHSQRPHRAIDLAMDWEMVKRVGTICNQRWVYDPRRPNLRVVVTKKHGTGGHAHLQVHQNTILRREMEQGVMA